MRVSLIPETGRGEGRGGRDADDGGDGDDIAVCRDDAQVTSNHKTIKAVEQIGTLVCTDSRLGGKSDVIRLQPRGWGDTQTREICLLPSNFTFHVCAGCSGPTSGRGKKRG